MYFESSSKNECCGCKACADACPTNAISFQYDYQGFWYPKINRELCINCKKCENVCAFGSAGRKADYSVFAAWSKSEELRDKSSSGGIFSKLSETVLSNGGAVIGAAFSDGFSVFHTIASTVEEAEAFRNSKYVQSDTEGVFLKTKDLLESNRSVLFSGTPCQISAIKSYLNKDYDNLICCDVICYGVPSPKVYWSYLSYLENKYHSKIQSIDFKDKRYGWDYYTTNISFENGKSICEFGGDSYKKFMIDNISIRPSCLECRYGVNNSVADISLGDFYGVNKYILQKEPKNGVSCVICRSDKGKKLFEAASDELTVFEVNSNDFFKDEVKKPKVYDVNKREEFFEKFSTGGYEYCLEMLDKPSLKAKSILSINKIKRKLLS